MTLVKFKRPGLPWFDTMFPDLLGADKLLTNDFLLENKWVPSMNVKETDDLFEIEIAAPGFNKKDFEISIENGLLKISAENKEEIEKKDENKNYCRSERRYGSFKRSFQLTDQVIADKISASFKSGVLTVTVPKAEEVKPKEIEIKVS